MIRFFTGHPTAANLMMLALVVMGLYALPSIRRETFPDFAPSELEIRIIYPGATAEEVEEAVCQRVEDAIDGVSYVDEIRADAREGMATIVVEMSENGDFGTFMRDIEKEVEAIVDFPDDVEDPVIREIGQTTLVLAVLVSGPMSTPDLKAYCEGLKERLKELGITLVDVLGFSDHQFRIELSRDALQYLNLSASRVAEIISRQNVDLPAGGIETRERDILLRFVEQRRSPEELEDLVVLAGQGGAEVRLGDIAKVHDVFEVDEDKVTMDGRRVGILNINKTDDQDTIRIANAASEFLEKERVRQPQVKLVINQDQSKVLIDRLDMLVTNGWQGLVLVFITLWLFFSLKISFWVAMGLPVSFLGAFYFIPGLDMTINMLTMIGLLLALGLMMDDAIVIAENIAAHREQGKSARDAAIDGTKEVFVGVVSSFITTICILGPLINVQGQIGKVLRVIPIVLILVMAVSLIEAFFILPSHLLHAMHGNEKKGRIRLQFDAVIEWVRERLLGSAIDVLLKWRYLFFGIVVALFILSIGMVRSGRLKMVGFPELEGDVVVARLLMPQGTPLARTESTVARITSALDRTNAKYKPEQPEGQDLVRTVHVQFNRNSDAFESGPHVATVSVDLLSAETRYGRIDDYLTTWRKEIGDLPDVVTLTLSEPSFGPSGRPIEIRLTGKDLDMLKGAATDLRRWFEQYEGVMNLADDLRAGKPELRVRLKEGAVGLGLDAATMAHQLRAAFQGITADEIQIGPEAYEIDVRLERADQDSIADLEYFYFTLADGKQVPLSSVAQVEAGRGFARIARFNGLRTVTLRGDLDTRVANTRELITKFRSGYEADLKQSYPGLKITIAGETEESGKTSSSMLMAMCIGLIGVFILLSFQFRSYLEPLVVMIAIPFAFIGVVWGHLLMGVSLSMPSIFGFIALAGVVVNDSILLVVFLKNRREAGDTIMEAAAQASRKRFRAVILTSSTTIAGLVPLLFETSLQAQVLIPLVISTVYGLAASTLLVLLVIPCFYTILGDLGLVEQIEQKAGLRKSNEYHLA